MKVTYNWLKDFVDIKIAPRRLADKLTMAGLEVTSLEEKDKDFVFEIEVTSNRPDCLSLIGIAREVAAITGRKLKSRTPSFGKNRKLKTKTPGLEIKIENKTDCPLYIARIIKDVKVGLSPDWLKQRLEMVGCRSVNNVVDITNYVLFESGEPLHAFDLDKLSPDTIIVRRALKDEKIIAIDQEEKILNPDILVIADREKSIAIAGVMGGKDTEVTESTQNILLEAAVFNPIIIRRQRQALGLQSESAYRFERGIDPYIVENASLRVAQLMQALAGGNCVLRKRSGFLKPKIKSIMLNAPAVNKFLGVSIAPAAIKRILNSLGFKIKSRSKNNFVVIVPSHRTDVNLGVDIIEEIARIFGFEFIPKSLPAVKPQVTIHKTRDLVSSIKNVLTGLGLNEVITYSLIDKELWANSMGAEKIEAIEILNPLSKEQEILRPNLIPCLARCIAYNLNQKQQYINIFEIAKVFSGIQENPEEKLSLGFASCGSRPLWISQGHIQDEVGFLHLKGIIEVLFSRLGIADYDFTAKSIYEIEVRVNGIKLGVLKRLEKVMLDSLGIKNQEIFAAEIALGELLAQIKIEKKFIPPSKYPGVVRDISLVLKEDIPVKDVIKIITDTAGELLREVKTIDYYKGKQIESGFKGLTFSCFYASFERTLTEAEINPLHAGIIQALQDHLQARIR